MAISNAKASSGVTFSDPIDRSGTSGSVSVGRAENKAWNDADVGYSFKVTATTGDVATLDLSDGAVTQPASNLVIEDAGVDSAGKPLSTMATLYAIEVKVLAAGGVQVGGTHGLASQDMGSDSDKIEQIYEAGTTNLGNVTLTLAAGASAEVRVVGKSTP